MLNGWKIVDPDIVRSHDEIECGKDIIEARGGEVTTFTTT